MKRGWRSRVTDGNHPALVRVARQGTPRSVEQDAPQPGHLEVAVMGFVALAAVLLVAWLAISLLDWIWGLPPPICFVLTCPAQAQSQPQPQSHAQPQPEPQPPPQPPRHSPRSRPHVPDRAIVDHCVPPRYWRYYSRRLRDSPWRRPIECWRDYSIQGP